jgi:hypothetical protein
MIISQVPPHVHQVCPTSTGYVIRNRKARKITISRGDVCRWDEIILGAVEGWDLPAVSSSEGGDEVVFPPLYK